MIDRVVAQVVAPIVDDVVVNGLSQRFFFVRFANLGPHVRVRLLAPRTALPHIRQRIEILVLERLAADIVGVPTKALPDNATASNVPSIVYVPYSPEVRRYGGEIAIEAAEQFFDASSRLCLSLVESIHHNGLDRFGIGLGVMLSILHGLSDGDEQCAVLAKAYSRSFGRRWVEHWYGSDAAKVVVDDPVSQLSFTVVPKIRAMYSSAKRDSLPPTVQAFAEVAREYRRRIAVAQSHGRVRGADDSSTGTLDEALEYLAPSLLHMTANRLGIDNPSECRLTESLAMSFSP